MSPDGSVQGTTPSYQLLARSPCLTASFHLIGSFVSPVVCFAPPHAAHPSHSSHRLIANAPSDKTSDEQAKRRTRRTIDNEQAERHDIRRLADNANTPPRQPYSPYKPHNARVPTTNTPTGKRPLYAHYNASDEQHGMTDETIDGTTTRRFCLPTRRRDVPPPLARLPTRTTERRTTRRIATSPTTRRHGTKETG